MTDFPGLAEQLNLQQCYIIRVGGSYDRFFWTLRANVFPICKAIAFLIYKAIISSTCKTIISLIYQVVKCATTLYYESNWALRPIFTTPQGSYIFNLQINWFPDLQISCFFDYHSRFFSEQLSIWECCIIKISGPYNQFSRLCKAVTSIISSSLNNMSRPGILLQNQDQ